MRASETVVPTTFVDDAELVWRELQPIGKLKQEELADALGWSRSKVLNFSRLRDIAPEAWKVVSDTTSEQSVSPEDEDGVSKNDTTVSFTEGLLRSILPLAPEQQLELVQDLAASLNFLSKSCQTIPSFRERNA